MKITVSIPAFRDAVARAQGAVDARSTLPILGNLLLSADAGRLHLTGTNLDQFLRVSVECDVQAPGTVALPAARLLAIAKVVQGPTLFIEVDEKLSATLKAGGHVYRLTGLAVEEFPSWPELEEAEPWTIAQAQMARALSRVAHAQSVDPTRFILNGIFLHAEKGEAHWVATDGRTLAKVTEALANVRCQVVIPTACVTMLLRALGDEGVARVRVTQNQIAVEADDVVLVSKLVDGTFPRWQPIVPTSSDQQGGATLDREATLRALQDLAATGYLPAFPSIRAEFDGGGLTLRYRTDKSEGSVPVTATCDGAVRIGVNPNFVSRALAAVKEDEVRVNWSDANSPLTITAGNFVSVIMPIRLQPAA